MSFNSIPVLIVGAGPTGLNLANLLAQYGIPHRIIDQKIEPIHTSNALAIQPRSLEMWESMGIAEQAIARGKKILGLSLSNVNRHIAKINFANLQLSTSFPFILGLPQAESEKILAEHLVKQGGRVERGIKLVDIHQTPENVTVELLNANDQPESVTCNWLIAADGSHSIIRKKLNLEFKGATLQEKFIMMDAIISTEFDPDYFHAILSPKGPLVFATLRDATRIICTVTHDPGIKDFENPTIEDFNYVIKQRSCLPLTINKSLWISHFTINHRLIDNYRSGQVLFAGDSAHVHSPVGGQGMNTGMQDSFNLAWKLAQVIKGKSNPKLLDTYNLERRPIAEKVLSNTTAMTEMVAIKNPIFITLRNAVMGFILKLKSVQNIFISRVSELGISYPVNNIIMNSGKRAPDGFLLDNNNKKISLYSLFKGVKHKLLFFTGDNCSTEKVQEINQLIKWTNENLSELFEPIMIYKTKIDFENITTYQDESLSVHKQYELMEGGICIVRPDQYIATIHSEFDRNILLIYLGKIKGYP